jgi:hypothetical protein
VLAGSLVHVGTEGSWSGVKGTSTNEAPKEDDKAASDDKTTDDAGKQSFLCKFGWREVLQQWRMVAQAG